MEIHYNVYGCFREPAKDIKLAEDAVEAGFGGVWIGDHFHPWIDSRPYTHHVQPWLGSAMAEVPDVPFGTSVTCPTMRYRPPILAQALATLDNMYPNRLHLGVGVGEALNEAPFHDGDWPEWGTRAGMLIEAIHIMRKLWNSDGYISHNGKYFEYEDIKLYTNPKGEIDIHWAAWGPQSSRAAGKYADHLITAAPADLIRDQIIPNLEVGLKERGRNRSQVDVTTEFVANYGNPDELVGEIRARGECIPDETELNNPDPRDIQSVADSQLEGLTDDEIAKSNHITGDTQDFIEWLRELEDAGVDRVLVGSNCGNARDTIEVFEEQVIPHF